LLLDETNAGHLLAEIARHPEWRLVGRELGYHLYECVFAQAR
jgi:hypothetical protein